jgi:hypothetical protein
VVLGELDSATAAQVDQLLIAANVFDALAAHMVYIARRRGWPALSDRKYNHPRSTPGSAPLCRVSSRLHRTTPLRRISSVLASVGGAVGKPVQGGTHRRVGRPVATSVGQYVS